MISTKDSLPAYSGLDSKQFVESIEKKETKDFESKMGRGKIHLLTPQIIHDSSMENPDESEDQVTLHCHLDSSPADSEGDKEFIKYEEEKNDSRKEQRWRRNDDKELFKLIREFERKGILTLSEIMEMSTKDAFSSKVLTLIARSFNWKGLNKQLLTRIQNLSSRDFSARELKQLKSTLKKQYKYKNLDYDELIYNFPGKSMHRLQEV